MSDTSERVAETGETVAEAVEAAAEAAGEAVAATAEEIIEAAEERAERAEEIAEDIAEAAARDRLHRENEELRKDVSECRENQARQQTEMENLLVRLTAAEAQIAALQQPPQVILEQPLPQSTPTPSDQEEAETIVEAVITPAKEAASDAVAALEEAAQDRAPARQKPRWI